LQGNNRESDRKSAAYPANLSKKHVQIQGFAEMRRLNSRRGGTGNQFGHNRQSILGKQGINSPQQGIRSARRDEAFIPRSLPYVALGDGGRRARLTDRRYLCNTE
jgi:hypothetical protein